MAKAHASAENSTEDTSSNVIPLASHPAAPRYKSYADPMHDRFVINPDDGCLPGFHTVCNR